MIQNKSEIPCTEYNQCTGCGACMEICPLNCIKLLPNEEGFLFPVLDSDKCNNCGLCQRICPINLTNESEEDREADASKPIAVYAAWNLDEDIRYASSSGGVFTALAEDVLKQGGIVVGAAFDKNIVLKHAIIDTEDSLERLRGSKYVQSEIPTDLFKKIKDFLNQNRKVLFSGTPCQVAGLQGFLRKSYPNLYCCDLVCHGVPSPLFLEKYVNYHKKPGQYILKLGFRDKREGWKSFGLCMYSSNSSEIFNNLSSDSYLLGFLQNYALRESCYQCKYAKLNRTGDITLGDFWGVEKKYPQYDIDNKGTSLVLINTTKGQRWLDDICSTLFIGEADIDTAVAGNAMLVRPTKRPQQRDDFYIYLKKLPFSKVVKKYRLFKQSFIDRVIQKVKRTIRELESIWRKSE